MVFKDILRSRSPAQYINLGAPEAEADSSGWSDIPLTEVYEDYHNLLPQLSRERFIVIGRKGSGKSAFSQFVRARATEEANLFCGFVKNSEVRLERLVHDLGHSSSLGSAEALFQWLIYTHLLKLLSENEAVSQTQEHRLLLKFLRKNSGYVALTDDDIRQTITTTGGEIQIEQLRRFFRANLGKQLEVRSERAPFYKLLPHLEEVLVAALRSTHERANDNSYVLFFDDLDVGFVSSEPSSSEYLLSLIRTARRVNNEVFAQNNINAKVVLLLRDDIEAFLSSRAVDTAKIFASYAATINWYEDYYTRVGEEHRLNLRKFINKRVEYAFRQSGLSVDPEDPWSCLVASDISSTKSSFRYIMPFTVFRPRDLLLFFQPLRTGKFTYPLSRVDVDSLVDRYADELTKELKNELSSFYEPDQLEMIFLALGQLSERPHTFSEAARVLESHCDIDDSVGTLEHLFDRSIIGNRSEKNWLTFKCREPVNAAVPGQLNRNEGIVVQYSVSRHVSRRGYASR
ncbi:MAG: hypothetical protein A49_24550 [Methyloceanibacter sp.]|nr:MAG: hypothetical protein A49_24550 [Methyloceanibacter sp.]